MTLFRMSKFLPFILFGRFLDDHQDIGVLLRAIVIVIKGVDGEGGGYLFDEITSTPRPRWFFGRGSDGYLYWNLHCGFQWDMSQLVKNLFGEVT